MWGRRRDGEQSRGRRRAVHAHGQAMQWEPCAVCSYDIRTGEGDRSCHWYACPLLPEELDVFCPVCNHDFYNGEGDAECGDPPRCDYAREIAPSRVAAVEEWIARHHLEHEVGST